MIEGAKILVTGPAGSIGYPLTRDLAEHNEVYGISRFGDPADRARVDALGVTTRAIDLGNGDFDDLPDDFDYVIHLSAHMYGDDYDQALKVNAEGTALLMTHCRKAKAFLVMSTTAVYDPNPDPWHAYLERDRLGDAHVPGAAVYSVTKIAEEGVARASARQLGLPTIVARMNIAYGDTGYGGLPGRHFDLIHTGQPVTMRWDPNPYSPIHDRDIFEQTEAILDAASPSCPVVNWGGDDPVASQEWCRYFGELLGVEPAFGLVDVPGSQRGAVTDNAKRYGITGPCRVHWRDGMCQLAEARGPRLGS